MDRAAKGAEAILEAAEALFAEEGFDAVSLSAIAERAGVAKSNILHHFRSKEGLYTAVLKRACGRSIETLDAPSGGPLEAFFKAHLKALFAHAPTTRLIQRELMERGKERGKVLAEEVFAETFAKVVARVEEAQGRGAIRADLDPSLLAFLLIAASVFFFETLPILEHLPGATFPKDLEGYAREVLALMMKGAGP